MLRQNLRKMLAILMVMFFAVNSTLYGMDLKAHDISIDNISAQFMTKPMTDEAAASGEEAMKDWGFLTIAFSIAEHFLEPDKRTEKDIKKALANKFKDNKELLLGQIIDIESVFEEDGKVVFRFEMGDEKGFAWICKKENVASLDSTNLKWEFGDKYAILIEHDEDYAFGEEEKDLKGGVAPKTDPIIEDLMQKEVLAEVYLDPETGKLKANRVRWIMGYESGVTSPEFYLGQEIDVRQIYSAEERTNLENWMKQHPVRGSPARFRIALGSTVLGWRYDIEHSNVSHSGVRDGVIYIGNIFLKYLMREENKELREEVLEKDEYRHLKGLGHGTEEEYRKRLEMVNRAIDAERFREINRAIMTNDVYYLRDMLQKRLKGNPKDIFEMIAVMNDIALGQPLYPVEVTYPIKHAVAMLSKEQQEQLVSILTGKESISKGYNRYVVSDEILLMLKDPSELEMIQNWIKVHAPELEGRSLWQISPEIWHEAGGLARVMQYHGVGMKELINGADVRFRHIEPHYQNRIDAKGKARPLDYTNQEQITHPIQGELEKVAEFTVEVGDEDVKTVVSKGINDLGIEVFLIRDIQPDGTSYYTHSLYNYKNEEKPKSTPDVPTWEEFSIFYSKASLELVRIIEKKEKEERERSGKEWKAPVLHLNDSQVALVSVYRKILLDEEKAKNEKDPSFQVDPVLEETVIAFTTHTYGNRRDYKRKDDGNGEEILDLMGIPEEYREFFERQYQELYDMASAGLRTSDWQGAVSRAHRDDVAGYDEWVNDPENRELASYYGKKGIKIRLVAVSNGDHRNNTAVYFDEKLRKIYGQDVDTEHPTPEQVNEAKKLAKKELALSSELYYSSQNKPKEGIPILDPDQMVVSYSGRLVPEKAGRERAFSDKNIEELVKRGVQVVICGNVQTNYKRSNELRDGLIALTKSLKSKGYKGKLIFVPRFTLDQQRALLAATDVQVQDSHPRTEAAGFTEADVSRTGGIEVGTFRDDNNVGEGLFQAQGFPIDFEHPGEGNAVVPKSLSSEAYLEVLLKLTDVYNKDDLKYYQATSIRLSRVLEARLTSAAYLREFSKAVAEKRRRKHLYDLMKEKEDMEKSKKMIQKKLFTPDPNASPQAYASYRVAELVLGGDIDEAFLYFFTSSGFQDIGDNLVMVTDTFNRLIEAYVKDRSEGENIKRFAKGLMEKITYMSEKSEVSKAVQLIAGQSMTIVSWIERAVEGAEGIRLTVDSAKQAKASDENRGNSFVDKTTLPQGVEETGTADTLGFYWRGIETIMTKIKGDNALKGLMHSEEKFDSTKENGMMYLMDHGFVKPNSGLEQAIGNHRISTIHETRFVNDLLPNSIQATSTGKGHFQGNKLDVKNITEGRGIQLNVKYSADGTIEDIIAQEVDASKGNVWCLALPGYVDYMINLGGLTFNDFSLDLEPDQAKLFNPGFDFGADNIKKVSDAIGGTSVAPYVAAMTANGARLVKTQEGSKVPAITWMSDVKGFQEGENLIDIYKGLTEGTLGSFTSRVFDNWNGSPHQTSGINVIEESEAKEREEKDGISLSKIDKIEGFMTDLKESVLDPLAQDENADKLFRMPVEYIESVGVENVRAFLTALQGTQHGFLEIYSIDHPEGVLDDHGLVTKSLSSDLTLDKRSRANTITILPVLKGEKLPTSKVNKRWKNLGDMAPANTIISPVGLNFDKSGIVRSCFLGLGLSQIAEGKQDQSFPTALWQSYKNFCQSQGADNFDLTIQDLITMATGENFSKTIEAVNKLIRSLPLMPVNSQEILRVYKHAEALIRA